MQTYKTVLATSLLLILSVVGIALFQQRHTSALSRYGKRKFAASVSVSWQHQARDVPTHDLTVFTIVTSTDSQELKFLIASSPYDVKVLGVGQKFEKYRSKAMLLLEAILCAVATRLHLLHSVLLCCSVHLHEYYVLKPTVTGTICMCSMHAGT